MRDQGKKSVDNYMSVSSAGSRTGTGEMVVLRYNILVKDLNIMFVGRAQSKYPLCSSSCSSVSQVKVYFKPH